MGDIKERYSIIISDIHGSKHYNVHQVIKKIAIYIILFIFLIILIGGYSITFLTKEVKDLESKKYIIEKEYKDLEQENKKFNLKILDRTDKLKALNMKMGELEEIIGIKPTNDLSLNERVDLAKVTTTQKKLLFKHIPNGYPIVNKGVSSSFGWRTHPILKKKEFHTGIDLRAKMKTPIIATADGVINFARNNSKSGYGKLLIIDHNYGFKTLFGHLSKIIVKKGDFIKKGDIIAYTGNSGLSSGPHLHYEVRFIQMPIEPAHFLKWDMKNYETIFKKEKRVKWQSLINQMTNQLVTQQVQQSSQIIQK